jgi:hypothetical protein
MDGRWIDRERRKQRGGPDLADGLLHLFQTRIIFFARAVLSSQHYRQELHKLGARGLILMHINREGCMRSKQ